MKKVQTPNKTDPPAPVSRPINAKFQSRIPAILEEICKSLMVIEPAVQDVTIPLREFVDYLDFEIAKVSLDIKKKEWESVVDINEINADKAWLAQMQQLRKDFDVEAMTSSVTFIRTMTKRVRDMFDMRVAY
ncbi:hypothetical protein V1279_002955 [Bradyrhizobium sp. AZCC 1610]|uniref:hypothetical protein n=1 Tax=Bradyrhizobium sp. AZCC 1610 TaxID=3117020 RepID=UPI002FF247F7